MRCKNCGYENDDNLYICQNCGSPLYDEVEVDENGSTVEFKKIGGNNNNSNEKNNNNNNNNNDNNNNGNDDDEKKKKLTIAIIVLCVILIAVVAGIIGAVVANNGKDDVSELSTVATTNIPTTQKQTTTKPTTTQTTTQAILQYKITVEKSEGGDVKGGGIFEEGEKITIEAIPSNGYTFDGWYVNDKRVSSSLTSQIEVTEDVKYVAKFKKEVVSTALSSEPSTVDQNNKFQQNNNN